MRPIDRAKLQEYISREIVAFHDARIAAASGIKLRDILKRKNPYLFRAKNLLTASDLVFSMLEARLSSSEEEIFGRFLERLAVFISQQACDGRKSSAKGIDLEFENNGVLYLVSVKSGPNWGNSSQYRSLETDFKAALTVQRQARPRASVQAVLGMCYGKNRTTDTGLYLKIAGQNFWHFISEDPDLYADLVDPIGYEAAAHSQHYVERRAALVNTLMEEFVRDFCYPDGRINWKLLIEYNSRNLG